MELPFRAARLQVSFGAAAARPEPRTRAALSARFLRAVAAAAAAAAAAGRRGGGGGGRRLQHCARLPPWHGHLSWTGRPTAPCRRLT